MYPSRFKYEAPSTVEEAIALLTAGNGEAKVLLGFRWWSRRVVRIVRLESASRGSCVGAR